MPDYQLSATADADLAGIYTYSFVEFGELRADAYFQSLEECLQKLAENPQLGKHVAQVQSKYRQFVHERHIIYYKKKSAGILVVRILGPGMAPDRHLP